ncbi:unnamed protein product [Camellia sinensis]
MFLFTSQFSDEPWLPKSVAVMKLVCLFCTKSQPIVEYEDTELMFKVLGLTETGNATFARSFQPSIKYNVYFGTVEAQGLNYPLEVKYCILNCLESVLAIAGTLF